MRVMLDGVFNHIGFTNEIWQDVLKNQENSAFKDWFHIHKWPVSSKWPGNKHKLGYDTFAFTERMPKWNTENPAAREYLLKAAVFWIKECDIDAWRLDVSDEVSFDFWREFCSACRSAKSSFYIIGEMWHDASPWLQPQYFNAAMNYPIGFAVRDFFLTKTIDAETFTVRLVNALSRYSSLHNRLAFNLLDSHDTERALHLAGGDKTALQNAFTFLLCLPGSPCIYYGTEVGMTGGRDPDCRRPMLWDDDRINSWKIDKNLLTFFKNSVNFRNKHIDIIQSGKFSYNNTGGKHIWTITGKTGGAISLVYGGTGSVYIEES
jgi:neopullulanase